MNEHIPEPDVVPCKADVHQVMQVIADGGFDADGFSQHDWINRMWDTDFISDLSNQDRTLLLSMVSDNYAAEKYEHLVLTMENHIANLLKEGITK
jgi:hypothetical protein